MSENGYYVLEHGRGVPLVMLHGMMGDAENWRPIFPHLPEGCRALALRFPFFQDGVTLHTVEAVGAYLESFLDSRGIQSAYFCGNSLGGHVALNLAARSPQRVRGLVLAGSSGLFEKSFAYVSGRPPRSWVHNRIRDIFYDEAHVTDALVDDVFKTISVRRNARDLVAIAKSAKHDNVSDRLGKIACPVLLIWGRQDTITPPDTAHEMAGRLPHAELVWLDRCGHAPMMEHPAEFGQAVARWWRKHVTAGGDATP